MQMQTAWGAGCHQALAAPLPLYRHMYILSVLGHATMTEKVASWSIADVQSWLAGLGLPAETVTSFKTNAIDGCKSRSRAGRFSPPEVAAGTAAASVSRALLTPCKPDPTGDLSTLTDADLTAELGCTQLQVHWVCRCRRQPPPPSGHVESRASFLLHRTL